jgi:hypothetical protein
MALPHRAIREEVQTLHAYSILKSKTIGETCAIAANQVVCSFKNSIERSNAVSASFAL